MRYRASSYDVCDPAPIGWTPATVRPLPTALPSRSIPPGGGSRLRALGCRFGAMTIPFSDLQASAVTPKLSGTAMAIAKAFGASQKSTVSG